MNSAIEGFRANEQGIRPLGQRFLDTFARRPVASSVGLGIADVLLTGLSTIAAQFLLPGSDAVLISLIAATVVTAAFVAALGLWRPAGYNGPSQWRNLGVLIVPALIIIVGPFLAGVKTTELSSLAYLAFAYALVGFREETLWRGVALRGLMPSGAVTAVVISGLVFGASHIANVLVRNPAIVFSQMIGAACFGIAMGALRLRTNSIWPVIVLHMLSDLLLHYSNLPVIPVEVAKDVLLLAYAIYLLRDRKAPASDQTEGSPTEAAFAAR